MTAGIPDSGNAYLPHWRTIRAACKRIRDGWSEQERQLRAGMDVMPLTVTEAEMSEECRAYFESADRGVE